MAHFKAIFKKKKKHPQMPNLCCWPLPFHCIQVYNCQAGLSGTQRTHIFLMPAASFEIADGPGSFQAFDPPIPPCASFSSLGQECSIASSPSTPGRVFVRGSTGSVEQSFKGLGKGQHMWRAACADSLHLMFVFKKKKLRDGWKSLYISVVEFQMCLEQQLYYLKSPFLQLQWI